MKSEAVTTGTGTLLEDPVAEDSFLAFGSHSFAFDTADCFGLMEANAATGAFLESYK